MRSIGDGNVMKRHILWALTDLHYLGGCGGVYAYVLHVPVLVLNSNMSEGSSYLTQSEEDFTRDELGPKADIYIHSKYLKLSSLG